jgi:hypothetical protein
VGVVDQNVDRALVLGDIRGRGGDGDVVGHVDGNEPRAERSSDRHAPFEVAGSEQHGVTEFDETAGGLTAEALVRPGDEGDRHPSSIRRRRGTRPGTPRR